ncbi:hypothetical protein ADUPG1_000162 [Aduncisulcus paluster]|uniref:Uncharacterized protein n=1 Tax=Aduncisulcus paluster TaxID=2918883 RepID=A0ABQ5K5F3_9EUKA|nr:hypothetical protein ADUPG1_000162 [Aduncisulcus paluster]
MQASFPKNCAFCSGLLSKPDYRQVTPEEWISGERTMPREEVASLVSDNTLTRNLFGLDFLHMEVKGVGKYYLDLSLFFLRTSRGGVAQLGGISSYMDYPPIESHPRRSSQRTSCPPNVGGETTLYVPFKFCQFIQCFDCTGVHQEKQTVLHLSP